jgi:hypothetical protein
LPNNEGIDANSPANAGQCPWHFQFPWRCSCLCHSFIAPLSIFVIEFYGERCCQAHDPPLILALLLRFMTVYRSENARPAEDSDLKFSGINEMLQTRFIGIETKVAWRILNRLLDGLNRHPASPFFD